MRCHLVAVAYHHLPRGAIFRRDASHHLAHVGVVVSLERVVIPAVHLGPAPRAFKRGVTHDVGGGHVGADNGPVAGRNLPLELVVFGEQGGEVYYVGLGHHLVGGVIVLSVPLIFGPLWCRRLVHAGQNFLQIACHHRLVAQLHAWYAPVALHVTELHLEFTAGYIGNPFGHRRRHVVSGVKRHVGAVNEEILQVAPAVAVFHANSDVGYQRTGVVHLHRAQCHRFIGAEFNHLLLANIHFATGYRMLSKLARKCQHSHVAQEVVGLEKFHLRGFALTGYIHTLRSQVAHTLFGLNPRATHVAPARAVEQTYLNAQFRRCLQSGVQYAPPLLAIERHIAARHVIHPLVADEGAIDALLLHAFEIVDYALLGGIVRYPVPVARELTLLRSLERDGIDSACGGASGVVAGDSQHEQ